MGNRKNRMILSNKEIEMKLITILLTVCLSFSVMAQSSRHLPFTSILKIDADKTDIAIDDPMYIITDIEVEEIETPYVYSALEDKGVLDDITLKLDKLIAIGKKIWAIIEKNKPVVNTDFAKAISVIPEVQGGNDPSTTFSMMSGWKLPKAKSYRVSYKNGFGMKVITFDYTVTFQYGGKYDGVGNYLTGVNVFAGNISVSWGFTFNAKTSLVTITNNGTMQDPVAGATLQIDYKTESVIRSISSSQIFHVTGLGEIVQLN